MNCSACFKFQLVLFSSFNFFKFYKREITDFKIFSDIFKYISASYDSIFMKKIKNALNKIVNKVLDLIPNIGLNSYPKIILF